MTITELPAEAQNARRARARQELDALDYRRALRALHLQGHSQVQIARWVGVSQPTVLSVLRTAANDPAPLAGFSGATPLEICSRYAAGFITRDRLIDELARYPYAPANTTDGYDSLIVNPPGTWAEVSQAHHRDLIDDDTYEEILNRNIRRKRQ